MPRLSKYAKDTQRSAIRELQERIKEAEKYTTVYRLDIGDSDFNVIPLRTLLPLGKENLKYGSSQGDNALIECIAKQYEICGISKDNIGITNGSSEAILFTIIALLDEEQDAFLIPEPAFPSYFNFLSSQGKKAIPIPRTFDNSFRLPDKNTIDQIIDNYESERKKIGAIVVINPSNPDGHVYSNQEMQILAEIAKERDMWFIVDSAYKELDFKGKLINPFCLGGLDERLIEFITFSKHYGISGARVGAYISKSKEFFNYMNGLLQNRSCPSGVGQDIALMAIKKMVPEIAQKHLNIMRQRLQVVDAEFNRLRRLGVRIVKPEGSIYLMAQISSLDTAALFEYMISPEFYREVNSTITFVPAKGFYVQDALRIKGYNELRIALVQSEKILPEAIKVLGVGIEAYRKTRGA